MRLTSSVSPTPPSSDDYFPESGPEMADWVRDVYGGLVPAFRRSDDGIAVVKAHSIITSLGFTERETVRGIARLVGANYLDREDGTLYLGDHE